MQVKFKRQISKYTPIIKGGILGIIVLILLILIVAIKRISDTQKISPALLWHLVKSDYQDLKQQNERTNLLLLGIGGENHEGGKLTDTMLVASINLQDKKTVLISIPRDIWIPTLKDKINQAYEFGEKKSPGGGLILSKSVVEEVLGIPIHYAVLIDFNGFKKLVDLVGGIDVGIDKSFTDNKYPIAGRENDECNGDKTLSCRYETVTFNIGIEHMDGERTLKYVRSRHSEDENGNDFSRGNRQRAVLSALVEKVLSKETVTDWSGWQNLYTAFRNSVTTDLNNGELMLLGKLFKQVSIAQSVGLTQDEQNKDIKGLLVNPPEWQYEGKWVLVPKAQNYSQIHKWVECILSEDINCEKLLD